MKDKTFVHFRSHLSCMRKPHYERAARQLQFALLRPGRIGG